jgi:hypothetical protein
MSQDPRYQDQGLAQLAAQVEGLVGQQQAELEALQAELDQLRTIEQEGIWLPFSTYDVLPSNQSGSSVAAYSCTVPRDLTVVSWYQAIYIVTTNDGSNYWTVSLKRLSDHVTIASFDTSAMSPGTWARNSETGLGLAITTSHLGLYIHMAKTGSPGNWYLMAPAMLAL